MGTGRFAEIDDAFAELLMTMTGRVEPGLRLAAQMVSRATREKHVCLDLSGVGREEGVPPLAEWVALLRGWDVVTTPEGAAAPLVIDHADRLYLHRYWLYEKTLADFLLARADEAGPASNAELLENGLDRLFAGSAKESPDPLQRKAAATAATRSLTVITGGPGTGKTSTVVKVLALLLEQAGDRRLDIAMAAPTGKAAARMKDSVKAARDKLDVPASIKATIPAEASTLHRLLGVLPGSPRSRRNAGNPLPHDVLIVDEASMIDLPMMSKLCAAMAPGARLILLGDRDQLASVDPGRVFGDMCDVDAGNRLAPSIVVLENSHRFKADSVIGKVSRLVNEGRGAEALKAIEAGASEKDKVAWHDLPKGRAFEAELEKIVVAKYEPVLNASSIDEAFDLFDRFRILCAYRGESGVDMVNRVAERALRKKGLVHSRGGDYKGRPIIVTENDYRQRLFNGDIGILWPTGDSDDSPLAAFFLDADKIPRATQVGTLPKHETAFGMTVHKSQGSEFDEVCLLFGRESGQLLKRELVYTGITRAKKTVDIWGEREAFIDAVSQRVERRSGLKDALRAKRRS